MPESPPLERPAEIYRPFTDEEREVLSTFVANVRHLAKMRFFEQVPNSASVTHDARGARADMAEPDDEAVRAAVTAFRQIYTESEPTSAAATLNLLKRSVRARSGPNRDEALAAIRELRDWLQELLNCGIGLGIVFDNGTRQRQIDPRTILDTYFHGHYLHSGNEKSQLARLLDGLEPWARYTLYSVMWKLTQAYYVIANGAELALQTPVAADPNSLAYEAA
jgi:hypothetical protein